MAAFVLTHTEEARLHTLWLAGEEGIEVVAGDDALNAIGLVEIVSPSGGIRVGLTPVGRRLTTARGGGFKIDRDFFRWPEGVL